MILLLCFLLVVLENRSVPVPSGARRPTVGSLLVLDDGGRRMGRWLGRGYSP